MRIRGIWILCILLFVLSACTQENATGLTLKKNESEFMETFNKIPLGTVLNFDATWNQADKTWIRFWAEGYQDGKKVDHPLSELRFGQSPSETEKGSLGFGMIKSDDTNPMLFLYAPGGSMTSPKIEMDLLSNVSYGWDYAIQDGEILSIQPGETKILGVYRETMKNGFRSGFDYNDEKDLEELINSFERVIIFKVEVAEQL